MCGIVVAVARRNVIPVLLEGLRKLEYRGYDSAGLAVLTGGGVQRFRSAGRVADLQSVPALADTQGETGIAHTRWATHGIPAEHNAHPHVSNAVALVHNGIIENHHIIKQRLVQQGYVFASDTDSEVVAHLIDAYMQQGYVFMQACRAAVTELQGAYAIGVIHGDCPGQAFVVRRGAPLLLGLGDGEFFAASDASALLQVTQRMVYLEDGDCVELSLAGPRIFNKHNELVIRAEFISQLSAEAVGLGPYQHYMQKEIFEQPSAVGNTLDMAMHASQLVPELFGVDAPVILSRVQHVLILACGTSYHAGLVARYWLESLAGVSVTVEIASEYRYRDSVSLPNTLVVALSQSGETADTLAAVSHAAHLGLVDTLAICNVPESALTRVCRLKMLTRAGPEIGVASTKAFTTQLAALFVLTLVCARLRGRLSLQQELDMLMALRHLPAALSAVLAIETQIVDWAYRLKHRQNALFLGRGVHYPIAMEGALKLKEVTYIHAEAYAAGELKHGPLALIDRDMPVIIIAPNDALLEKLKSNMQEVRARGGELYVFADHGTGFVPEENVHIIEMPDHADILSPILHVVPLQLLAYHTAVAKGTDVDKPRNLAKSVTVE